MELTQVMMGLCFAVIFSTIFTRFTANCSGAGTTCLCNSRRGVQGAACVKASRADWLDEEVRRRLEQSGNAVCRAASRGCAAEVKMSNENETWFYCSTADESIAGLQNRLEYVVQNGRLHELIHQCTDSTLCNEAAVSELRSCDWRTGALDEKRMRRLRCRCSEADSAGCGADGVCDFAEAEFDVGRQFPSCRYVRSDDWTEAKEKGPLLQCWLHNRAYDRHLYVDGNVTYLLCRDADLCNEPTAAGRDDERCPFAKAAPLMQLTTTVVEEQATMGVAAEQQKQANVVAPPAEQLRKANSQKIVEPKSSKVKEQKVSPLLAASSESVCPARTPLAVTTALCVLLTSVIFSPV